MKPTIFESELVSYWDWNKNTELNPKNTTVGSYKKGYKRRDIPISSNFITCFYTPNGVIIIDKWLMLRS